MNLAARSLRHTTSERHHSLRRKLKSVKPYIYILPILLFAVLFTYHPFVRTFLYSFSVVNFKGEMTSFAGLDNFKYLFSNQNFYIALKNTLLLVIMFVPLNLILSLGFALLSNKRRKFSAAYETMFTLPMAVSMSAVSMIFKLLLNPTVGIVNTFFHLNVGWFSDKRYALLGILLVCIWMGVAFDYLLFLAALRNVPAQLMEAATIDGAGWLTRLFRIQLPMVTPTILFVVSTNIMQSIMTSGPIMIITEGGPARSTTTLIYLMFTSGYQSSNYSLASCVSLVTFLLTLGFTLLAFAFERKRVHYE